MQRTVNLPAAAVLAIGGGIGWLVGTVALGAGLGTVVLALGLALTVWLVMQARRYGEPTEMEPWRTKKLLRIVVVGVLLIIAASAVLSFFGYGELAFPVGFGVVGAVLIPASSLLGSRGYFVLGAALMVLAAVSGFVALNTAGDALPRGIVGLGAGLMLWVAAAHRMDLLHALPERIRDLAAERARRRDTDDQVTDDHGYRSNPASRNPTAAHPPAPTREQPRVDADGHPETSWPGPGQGRHGGPPTWPGSGPGGYGARPNGPGSRPGGHPGPHGHPGGRPGGGQAPHRP